MKPAASLRALMTQVIDYAGMFPPASLSLDESIRNYARYVREPDSWMLGRFICQAGKLSELARYFPLFDGTLLRLAALGSWKPEEEFKSAYLNDSSNIRKFIADLEAATVETYETRAPLGAFAKRADTDSFIETDLTTDWRERVAFEVKAIAHCGFKLRTGGIRSDAFPPADQIALAIALCRDKQVPIKFTAGLHHPIRHFNSSVNTKMHGFINVFGAGVMAHVHRLSEEQLVRILLDEDPASFSFDDDGMRWKDFRATTAQTVEARKRLVTSFGSCSFDEPREDLRSLGWL